MLVNLDCFPSGIYLNQQKIIKMKNVFLFILTLLSGQLILAQTNGTISYKESVKMDINVEGDHGGIDLSQYLPESTTFYKELQFNEQASIYREGQGEAPEDTEIESDDGSFKMTIMHNDDIEDVFYVDFDKKSTLQQQGFMGKEFLIEEEYPLLKWKVTGEKVSYLDYECMKATTTHEDKEIVAWFAPQISAQVGPRQFGQLPGAILMLSIDDGKTEIMATQVNLSESIGPIEPPKKGKRVTKEEYDQVIDDKMKEIQSQNKGGNTFIIKG